MSRRTIIQRNFINGQDIAVESLQASVTINSYDFKRVGDMIYGIIKFTNNGTAAISAGDLEIAVSGLPKIDSSWAICGGCRDDATKTPMYFAIANNAATGAVKITSGGQAAAGKPYRCQFIAAVERGA